MRHPHADHRRETLADVVAGGHEIFIDAGLLAVGVERAGERRAEAGDVGAPFGGRDVIDVAVDVLGVFSRVLQRDVPRHALGLAPDRDHVGMNRVARTVQPLDEFDHAPLVVILFLLAAGRVGEGDPHPRIQKRQFLQAAGEHVPGKLGLREDLRIGLEGRLRTGAGCRAHLPHGARRLAALVFLLPDMPFAGDLDLAPFGKKVDHGDAHAVEAAGGLVGTLLELAAELQHRHHPLERGDVAVHLFGELRMPVGRDAATVVLDGHTAIDVDRDADVLRKACHAFVDRVVHHFVNEMMQTAGGVVADVHAETFADMLPVGKVLQVCGRVLSLL